MKLEKLRYLLIGFSLILLITSCDSTDNFVVIEEDEFRCDGEPYFPLLLNYIATVRNIDDSLVIGPSMEYDKPREYESYSKDGVHLRLKTHFRLIKEMGFNSIRLVGLNDPMYSHEKGRDLFFKSYDSLEQTSIAYEKYSHNYLSALNEVIRIAELEELKVMFVLPKPQKDINKNLNRINYIKDVLKFFSNEPNIFAYDFFNEPLYFDNSEYSNYRLVNRSKLDAYNLVKSWDELMDEYAPKQLFTIGQAEPIEVLEWDPSLLPLDFVSFHTYHPLRVSSEIYWFEKYIKKPWIISETSLPAENDSISYKSQEVFMKEILQKTIDCGGIGFGWWQYQEVTWGPFEHNYTALLNLAGKTKVSNGETVIGTMKPAGKLIPQFEFQTKEDCDCPVNYFNMLGLEKYKITGKVINESNGQGIEGAVIRGWTNNWTIGQNTFTDENGVFNLYSNQKCVNFAVSAPGMTTSKFYQEFNYTLNEKADFAKKLDTTLEYHSIHFQKFLKDQNPEKSTLDFDEEHFSKYQYSTEMENVKLRKVRFNPY